MRKLIENVRCMFSKKLVLAEPMKSILENRNSFLHV